MTGVGATPGHGSDRPAGRNRSKDPARSRRPPRASVRRSVPSGDRRAGRGFDWSRRAKVERGSASLWLLAIGLVLVLVSLGASAVGAARVARHQARVAADLGALAGAAHALDGQAAACARAATIAAANSARIATCSLDGLDLRLGVEVPVEPLPGLRRVATATARAGPVQGAAP
ncbi:Rv3654c family TadE-like protein [Plantactinospora sonchi]|uniref:Rv3654c family TadE-like protein n=1 Tax=Plantactinospora sonchi TaxID=1544735 RepID=A0ABU7RY04_9ACTN